jgi:hypothetical protein
MACKPHTKEQLIKLVPDHSLDEHIQELNLLECIQQEINEQKVFWPEQVKIKMCYWSKQQFEQWYNIVEQEVLS